ncbi:Periplasmic beta-glucosidase [Tritrichomonas foetus]|uniref:beta-glucosidase n=1 Tax=Tritrichomonas foetus TaxID=1144522 RepID=A0A1J4K6J3_9EUKA|nr:Periplasmic beta-glucosidase [Tritrichomonas foetus]|eukprot:OHT05340.1 Periplasmic beta-glucosidase [Tritrichomonas foetus]
MIFCFLILASAVPIYLDVSKNIDERVDDLMNQMTLEEKIGQLVCPDGRFNFTEIFNEQHIGATFFLFDDDAKHAQEMARNTRLKIPLIMGIDAIHGNSFYNGSTIFPTQLAASCSWDVEVMKEMAQITASEMKYTGTFWTFSPVLCLTRDLRWGRVGESFGEDPYLIGVLADAMITAYQDNGIIATAKHFVGYGETIGGRDASEGDLSRRKLLSYFTPPFEKVSSIVSSVMSSYQALDGTPAVVNHWLLNETLKEKWGFKGFVVSDYDNVGRLINDQQVFDNFVDASLASVKAGNDMFMHTPQFFGAALEAVNQGKLPISYIDESCRRILRVKFEYGLFEDDRMADKTKVVYGTEENRKYSLKAAEKSAVLLKNNGILPLDESLIQSFAVIGPNADNIIIMNGDWSLGSQQKETHGRNCTVTILDGIKNRMKNKEINYAGGVKLEDDDPFEEDIHYAVENVQKSDISVVVIGDRLKYSGEGKSTGTLDLMGNQIELLEKIMETGKKFIIDVISTKPVIIPQHIVDNASAIIHQFSPGMLGGTAFSELIFGDINPSGKLTVSYPVHVGQQPVWYNQVRGQHGTTYADLTETPMWSFGHGLSYSNFIYSDINISNKDDETNEFLAGDEIIINMKIKNDGKYDGAEIVQIYIMDNVTSSTWAVRELKAFQRVEIDAGDTKEVSIKLNTYDFSIVNASEERVVEPGDFVIQIGKSSDDIVKNFYITILPPKGDSPHEKVTAIAIIGAVIAVISLIIIVVILVIFIRRAKKKEPSQFDELLKSDGEPIKFVNG